MRARALALLGVAGCISSGVVVCPDQTICPDDTQCREITVWAPNDATDTEFRCVPEADVAACLGLEEQAGCTAIAGDGRCHEGACFAAGCGNGLVDVGEACDDENQAAGDGCSPACDSVEVCGNEILDPVPKVGGLSERCDDGDVAPHDGCSSVCDVELPRWRQLVLRPPGRRMAGGMVFDSNRGQLVMFGGLNSASSDELVVGSVFPCVTRSGDCVNWTPIEVAIRPPRRHDHAMAYDQARDRVIVSGGFLTIANLSAIHADLWEWNGRRWTQVPQAGEPPGQRFGAVMAYDPIHFVTVLYGGTTISGDVNIQTHTYEWNGKEWKVGGSGPSAMTGHSMAFDPVRGVTVLVGRDGVGKMVTWHYDAGMHAWTDVTPSAMPPARFGANLVWDAIAQQLMLFAGEVGGTALDDLWFWNGSVWTSSTEKFPRPLTKILAAADPERGRVVTFGGFNVSVTDSSFVWDSVEWSPSVPSVMPRGSFANHAATYDAARDRVVVVRPDASRTETWELANDIWIEAGDSDGITGPDVREAAMTYDARHRESVLFGGLARDQPTRLNATWTWDGTRWTQKIVTGAVPAARNQARMVYDVENQRVVMFGGVVDISGTSLADTWVWDGSEWEDISSSVGGADGSPSARTGHAMAYDPIRREIVMFGGGTLGANAMFATDAMWIFDTRTSTWRLGPPGGPFTRSDAALAWNNARRAVVLVGGSAETGTPLGDTWEWDGTRWTELDLDQIPPPRNDHVLVSTSRGVLLVGGSSNDVDAWELRWENAERGDRCRDRRDPDGDGALGCEDPDCRATCTPLCTYDPHEVVCDATSSTCGDGVCDPLENCRLCAIDCACPAVCGDSYCDPGESTTMCPGDCTHVCGDMVCDPGETRLNCEGDCVVCDDTFCDPGETPELCPADCAP
ncbi:MAG: hypothetical protein H0V17_12260 [Deltaproteobacteria bacterium]|nr:hypothetical protein [Deltaproteobacteria bacterium]